jgi:hypothetical protein
LPPRREERGEASFASLFREGLAEERFMVRPHPQSPTGFHRILS